MQHYDNIDRTASLKRIVPDLYDYKTVLYVGARPDRHDYLEDFHKANYKIDVIEIWHPNVKWLRALPWINRVYHINFKKFFAEYYLYYSHLKYDIIFLWHVIEHIYMPEIEYIFTKRLFEQVAKKIIVIGCPWGVYHQGEMGGNPDEAHVSHLDYQIFEKYGYQVECLGKQNYIGSNITAIKKIK